MSIPLNSYHCIGFRDILMSKPVFDFIDGFEPCYVLLLIGKKQVHLIGFVYTMRAQYQIPYLQTLFSSFFNCRHTFLLHRLIRSVALTKLVSEPEKAPAARSVL